MSKVLATQVCVCVSTHVCAHACVYMCVHCLHACACLYTCVTVYLEGISSSGVMVTHEAAGIVVAHCLGIAEGLQQWV